MSWFRRLFHRRQADADLDEEIRFYLDQETQLRVDRGESPDRAADSAQRDFGNALIVKETTREMWGWTLLEDFGRDLRYSLRLLKRSPVFTAVAVLSLALGIGANTAIFSLADVVIFRKLPVAEPDRLYQVRGVHERGGVNLTQSYPLYRDIRDRNHVFTSTAATGSFAMLDPIALETPGGGRRELHARVAIVTGTYFSTLRVEPLLGRMLTPDDDRAPGAHAVAVISHRFWKRALDADAGATRSRLIHNDVSYAIVGVAPPGFTGISSTEDPDVWVPTMMAPRAMLGPDVLEARGRSYLYVFGRLNPGIGEAAASADLARVFADVERIHPERDDVKGEVLSMARGVQTLRERFEKPLFVLLGVVGLLLLIACANLAALLLARAAVRRHEIAVRLSLGASRVRLLRQFLTESLVIAVLGGAAGLALSAWGASLLIDMVTTGPQRLPIAFTVDWRILSFTGAVSVLAAVVFGVFPALQANRTPLAHATQSVVRTPSRLAGGRVLIAGQMALSLFLLIAAGLFIRSLGNLRDLDTGFARENVLVLMMDAAPAYGTDRQKYLAMYRELTPRIERLPGVRAASFTRESFFSGSASRGNIAYEGQTGTAPRSEWPFKVRITARFHETVGLSLIAGRTLSDRDDREAPSVAVVSESIARRTFPRQNALGKRFCFSDTFAADCAIEIVGIVRDVRYGSLREASPFTVYLPIEQQPLSRRGNMHVRTLADPRVMAARVQEEVRRFNPDIRVVHTTTLEQLVDESIVQDRLLATLSTWFAVLALLLAAVGLYGITSYGVQRRTNEIGLRMALGASRGHVQWMVLREVVLLGVAGAALGVPAALAASRLVQGLLFDLTPTDPVTVAGATVTLILVAVLAGYLPARRATRIDPIIALRVE
jgi:predicted permease